MGTEDSVSEQKPKRAATQRGIMVKLMAQDTYFPKFVRPHLAKDLREAIEAREVLMGEDRR